MSEGGFAKMLYEARKARGITLRKLGSLVGLSPSYLSELERSKRLPPKDKEKIRDIALVLNQDQEIFLKEADKDRARKNNPAFLERLFNKNSELAYGFYRESEKASDEDFEKAVRSFIEQLRKDSDD